jgi:hypothetical protein
MSLEIEQYKVYVADLGQFGARHDSARNFYITVLSALLVILSLAGKEGVLQPAGGKMVVLVGVGAITICLLWLFQTLAVAAIYTAKFDCLRALEKSFVFRGYTEQTAAVLKDRRYVVPIVYIECGVAVAFGLLFMAAMAIS